MANVEGNGNFCVVANAVELATGAIALYVRKQGIREMMGETVNRQLIADTVVNRIASNVRIQSIANSVKQ